MVNRKYIKQICKEILEMDVENIYFLEKEKRYIIYVNAKIKNTYMDLDIQNIYPLSHNIFGEITPVTPDTEIEVSIKKEKLVSS